LLKPFVFNATVELTERNK